MSKKRLAIITGGSRGIGSILVKSILRDMAVLNISRKPAIINESLIQHTLFNLQTDLQVVGNIKQTLEKWFGAHPEFRVKILIHNAATLDIGWLDNVSMCQVHQSFQINVYAPLEITNVVFNLGRFSQNESRVVYITSSLGRMESSLSFAGIGLYSITKAALSKLALIQSREFKILAPHIRVLRIHPGVVDTDMQNDLRQNSTLDPAFKKKTEALPSYVKGEWENKSPRKHMRTISASFAAEFILWVAKSTKLDLNEYDFYGTDEFHLTRIIETLNTARQPMSETVE